MQHIGSTQVMVCEQVSGRASRSRSQSPMAQSMTMILAWRPAQKGARLIVRGHIGALEPLQEEGAVGRARLPPDLCTTHPSCGHGCLTQCCQKWQPLGCPDFIVWVVRQRRTRHTMHEVRRPGRTGFVSVKSSSKRPVSLLYACVPYSRQISGLICSLTARNLLMSAEST